MSARVHNASVKECELLWPAARADRLFESADELRAYRAAGPWRIRVTDGGDTAILGAWREHLDVLAIRALWASGRHVAALVEDATATAGARGFGRVLSPLLPVSLLDPYYRAGMRPFQRVVAIQGHPGRVRQAAPPPGVRIRRATSSDLGVVAELDAACFDEFWRYGRSELRYLAGRERLAVAETGTGDLIGYTLATVSRGSATLSRLGTAPSAREHGLGKALLAEVARWAVSAGAATLALCTQEENEVSRALYAGAGLREVDERYAFGICDARRRERA